MTRLFMFILSAALAGCAPTEEPAQSGTTWHHKRLLRMVGDTVTTPDGKAYSSDWIAGKKDVLLYFSAKWCPPCRAFTPDLVQFARDNPDGDFAILLVSSDRSESDMKQYMKSYDMPFSAIDFADRGEVKSTWGGSGIPNLVWLGPDDQVIKGSYETSGRYSPENDRSYIGTRPVLEAFKNR